MAGRVCMFAIASASIGRAPQDERRLRMEGLRPPSTETRDSKLWGALTDLDDSFSEGALPDSVGAEADLGPRMGYEVLDKQRACAAGFAKVAGLGNKSSWLACVPLGEPSSASKGSSYMLPAGLEKVRPP
mmetsp:Transcript_9290/g.17106  ORF Transcript_9290/g.17106 Transcript_9290/m.17106 type:complete len:130 (+) Transcript_9290:114-503(+)